MAMPTLNKDEFAKLTADISASKRGAAGGSDKQQKFVKLRPGNNTGFLLLDTRGVPVVRQFQHAIPIKGKTHFVLCPERMKSDKPCPVCFALRSIRDERPELDIKGLWARARSVLNFLPTEIGSEPFDNGGNAFLLYGPNSIATFVVEMTGNPKWNRGAPWFDWNGAFPITITSEKTGPNPMDVEYKVLPDPQRVAIPCDHEKLAASLVDLSFVSRYTKEDYDKAVSVANQLIESKGGRPLLATDFPVFTVGVTATSAVVEPVPVLKVVDSSPTMVRNSKSKGADSLPICHGKMFDAGADECVKVCPYEDSCEIAMAANGV